jgi:hypothetical protein
LKISATGSVAQGCRCNPDYHFIVVDATAQSVRRLLNIFACLMLVFSLETTAAAHVFERPDASISASETPGEQIAEGHTPGDADQVPSDGDKGYLITTVGATAIMSRRRSRSPMPPSRATSALPPFSQADRCCLCPRPIPH